jgi:UDP-2,4-diacetamido-2,4,6-trideoxy-beta-L-altropyranose hydrolase
LLVVRADASRRIGTGHVVRSATLAGELIRRGWQAVLATRDLPPAMRGSLVEADIGVLELRADEPLDSEPDRLAELLSRQPSMGPIVIVTDHYGIDAAWHRRAAWATVIAAVDDLAERPQHVGLLLNQNLGATPARYAGLVPAGAELLLGPQFALVRPAFARPPGVERVRDGLRGRVPRVLVMLGGADEPDVTRRATAAAVGLGYAVDVVVGPAYAGTPSLRSWAERRPAIAVHANTTRVADLMEAADLCVGAAGSASWERCALGLPAILVTLAQNQVEVASLLASAGAAVSLGWHEDVTDMALTAAIRDLIEDPTRLRLMSEAAAAITDGRGTGRVADALEAEAGTRPRAPHEDES